MIHKALKLTRQFHRMKQVELAHRLEISPSYLSEIEKGKKTISVDLLDQYSRVFGIPIETFFQFSQDPSSQDPDNLLRAKKLLTFFQWVASDEDELEAQSEAQTEEASVGNSEKAVRAH